MLVPLKVPESEVAMGSVIILHFKTPVSLRPKDASKEMTEQQFVQRLTTVQHLLV
jgi:hypothetical protein